MIGTKWISHLCRVGLTAEEKYAPPTRGTASGAKYRAQWSVRYEGARPKYDCALQAVCALPVSAYRVGYVPNTFPTYGDADDWTESGKAGLYADPLFPLGARVVLTPGIENVFYFEIDTDGAQPGSYALDVRLTERDAVVGIGSLEFDVRRADLGDRDWIYTDWIHYDAIAREHRVGLFDDDFYRVFGFYLALYREQGANMLMIPAFTPALDTEVGLERTTAQLIEIEARGGGYRFGFGTFDRFVSFCLARGVRYLEFPPLVSQWTGAYAAKFRIRAESGEETRFGWKCRSDAPEYLAFLDAFLSALAAHLKEKGWWERAWFHLSDEPDAANAARVAAVERVMRRRLEGAHLFDTVMPPSRPKEGIMPVYASEDADRRRKEGEPVEAVYYCCEQCRGYVSNRFLNMPLVRAATIGAEMAACDTRMLLHWGFNFYNEVLSRGAVDPYADTTAGGNYPGGDAFIVYPDRVRDGALPSLRLAAMSEAHLLYRLIASVKRRDPESANALLRRFGFVGFCGRPRTVAELESLKEELFALTAERVKR